MQEPRHKFDEHWMAVFYVLRLPSLILQNYWSRETRQWDIYQNMVETYTVIGTCACNTFWKNSWTQIACSIMHRQKNWMHNILPMYAKWWPGYRLNLEAWCSRHSDARSMRKQAQEGELKTEHLYKRGESVQDSYEEQEFWITRLYLHYFSVSSPSCACFLLDLASECLMHHASKFSLYPVP